MQGHEVWRELEIWPDFLSMGEVSQKDFSPFGDESHGRNSQNQELPRVFVDLGMDSTRNVSRVLTTNWGTIRGTNVGLQSARGLFLSESIDDGKNEATVYLLITPRSIEADHSLRRYKCCR